MRREVFDSVPPGQSKGPRASRELRGSAALLLALAVTACGSRSRVLTEEAPALVVHNHARAGVVRILVHPCASQSDGAGPAGEAMVAEGETRRIELRRGCYDFDAFDAQGQSVGRQHGVDLRRPMEWSIAR